MYGKRQWERKDHLKDYCQKHSFNKTSRKEELQYIAVDDENKIIYCAIQEVDTKTWTTVFTGLFRSVRAMLGTRRRDFVRPLSGYTEKEKSIRLKTYFKFVIVREPLNRLLSVYKDRFIIEPRYTTHLRKQIARSLRPYDRASKGNNYISFSEFIQYFSKNVTRNQHWQQYEKICHPCVVNYDFIGHLETMEEDAPIMLRMAGIDAHVTFPPNHNSTYNSTGLSQVLEYYSQVPTRYITRIGELYRSDFEMFGYEYLGPVKQLLNQSITNGA